MNLTILDIKNHIGVLHITLLYIFSSVLVIEIKPLYAAIVISILPVVSNMDFWHECRQSLADYSPIQTLCYSAWAHHIHSTLSLIVTRPER